MPDHMVYLVISTFEWKGDFLIVFIAFLIILYICNLQVILYGDVDDLVKKQENVILMCNHQSTGMCVSAEFSVYGNLSWTLFMDKLVAHCKYPYQMDYLHFLVGLQTLAGRFRRETKFQYNRALSNYASCLDI